MKKLLLITLVTLLSSVYAQEETASVKSHFGISLNTSCQRGLETISVGSSLFYFRNKHQFELGMAFHPSNRRFQSKYGGELIYKYYPEGIGKRVNQFFIASTAVTYNDRFQTMWSGDYYRKELNAALLIGLGAEIKLFKSAYIAPSLSIGTSTYRVNAADAYYSYPMFKYYEFEVAPRISIGVRF